MTVFWLSARRASVPGTVVSVDMDSDGEDEREKGQEREAREERGEREDAEDAEDTEDREDESVSESEPVGTPLSRRRGGSGGVLGWSLDARNVRGCSGVLVPVLGC